MRFLPTILAGVAAVSLGGSLAMAASNDLPFHQMTVRLPDGGTLRVEYAGKVPPRLHVASSPLAAAWPEFPAFAFGHSFSDLQRISAEMDRQISALMKQANSAMRVPAGADNGLSEASLGKMPAGSMSYSFVSTSNGRITCSRSVEVTKPAGGAKPKVVTHSSGNCGAAAKENSSAVFDDAI